MIKTTIAALHESCLLLDHDRRITEVNTAFCQTFLVDSKEFLGHHLDEAHGGFWRLAELGAALSVQTERPSQAAPLLENVEIDRVFPELGRKILVVNALFIPGQSKQFDRILVAIEDITRLRLADSMLSSVRSRLDSALGAAEIATWEFDLDTNSLWADTTLAAMYGVTEQEARGGPLAAYLRNVHPDDVGALNVTIASAVQTGEMFETEYRIIDPVSGVRHVLARGRLEIDEVSGRRRLPGVVVDMTSRRQAEQQLKRSETQRRLALDSAGLGLWHIDITNRTLTSDARFRYLFGTAAQTISFEEAHAQLHPEDLDRIAKANEAVMAADGPASYEEEYRVKALDGSWRWVCAIGRTNIEDTLSGAHQISLDGTLADVTDRKRAESQRTESETRYRRLFESAQDGIVILDARELDILEVNPAMCELLGQSGEDLIGNAIWTTCLFEGRADARELMDRLKVETLVRFDSLTIYAADGQRREVELVGSVYDEAGRQLIQCNVRDITSRRRLETQIQTQAEELTRASRQKDEFLAMLAHELRNPLAPVLHALEIIADDEAFSLAAERPLGVIKRQVSHLASLVDDLTEISRITTGRIGLKRSRAAVNELIHNAVERAGPLLSAKSQRLEVKLATDDLYMDVDSVRIEQVIGNLLNNASKYSPSGAPITLTVSNTTESVDIAIRDKGYGIEPELLPTIFDLFIQGDKSLDRSAGGLGIGLALVRHLVDLHGGSVRASSNPETAGSKFVVRLPLADSEQSSKSPSDYKAGGGVMQPLRILLVDDNADAVAMTAVLLGLWGHDVTTEQDGQGALEQAEAQRPDVILLDIGLPLMNGYEVAAELRKRGWMDEVLLVAMTGYGREEDRQRTREAGFNVHLVKPVDASDLRRVLELAYSA